MALQQLSSRGSPEAMKEGEKGAWHSLRNRAVLFEKVKCIADGFEIEASHIQYNNPTERIFLLRVTSPSKYEIK